MFLSNASVRRPIAVSALLVALVLLGLNAWRKIGLEQMPRMDIPYVTILTVYPGASPTEIETDVARKIEDAVSTIDGLKHVNSMATENVCTSILEFELGVDVDTAAADVRAKIDVILNDLPQAAEKPKVMKLDINATPIITLALTGSVPVDELYDYADNKLRDRFAVVRGVANVELLGGSKREVHMLLDRKALAARGLTTMHVVQAVQRGVRLIPSGRVQDLGSEYSVKFDADYRDVAEMGNLEIANTPQGRVYLKDIGRVEMKPEEPRQTAFLDGAPAIGIRIVKKADANALKVVEEVRGLMDSLVRLLPGGMKLVWVHDEGGMIKASNDSALSDIWQGVLLTALILFFFLYNIRTTIIIAITMPMTIVIGMLFIYAMGYTMNTSTLLAIGLSVGVLVSNSIVVLESIESRLAEGKSVREATRIGASEVAVAVLASAGTNMVVFLPIAMMGSMVGLFFRPFAVTSLIVNIVSLFISFTLTPILCLLLLKSGERKKLWILRKAEAFWNGMFDRLTGSYVGFLRFSGRSRILTLAILAGGVVLLVHALWLFPRLGMSFTPNMDQGQIYVKLEYPTDSNLKETTERIREVENILKSQPELRHILTTVGKVEGEAGIATEGVYMGQIFLRFCDKTERSFTIFERMKDIREKLGKIPNAIVTVSLPSMAGGQARPITVQIRGDDLAQLDAIALLVADIAKRNPDVQDSDTSVREGKPEIRIYPKRAVLSDLGIAETDLGLALRGNIEGIKAGTYKSSDRTYDIRVKLSEEQGKDQVKEFLFTGAPGQPQLLGNLADIRQTKSPIMISRVDKQRTAMFYSDIGKNAALGTVVGDLSSAIDARGIFPPGYTYRFMGDYEFMQEASDAFLEAAIIAVVLTYLVLAAILESIVQPILIMTTLPLGLIGVFWALYLTGESVNVFVLLGIVMLIGIVVNNAVLLMDAYQKRRTLGESMRDGMLGAIADSFRPIVMITLAADLGMWPLAVGTGLGSELRTGIGIASAGGILVSALLTLLVIPLLYLLIAPKDPKDHEGGKSPENAELSPVENNAS